MGNRVGDQRSDPYKNKVWWAVVDFTRRKTRLSCVRNTEPEAILFLIFEKIFGPFISLLKKTD